MSRRKTLYENFIWSYNADCIEIEKKIKDFDEKLCITEHNRDLNDQMIIWIKNQRNDLKSELDTKFSSIYTPAANYAPSVVSNARKIAGIL